tara:strand:- start:79 stop:300 length:222 start_codon:yes stop_codon:yes gene_type:complete
MHNNLIRLYCALRLFATRRSWRHLEDGRELLLLRSIRSVAAAAAGEGSGAATMSGRGVFFRSSHLGHHHQDQQ